MFLGRKSSGVGGGIGGSGIFGLVGTVVRCDANDTSLYCSLAKLVNMLIMIMILLYIMYFVVSFAYPYVKGFSSKGTRRSL
jgi:hypothetical protein